MSAIAAAACVAALSAVPAFAQTNEQSGTVVALGDSITFGYNLGDNQAPSPKAYPFVLASWLGMTADDLGVPGWQSKDLLSALEHSSKMQAAVRFADVVTIDIGSNDLLGPAVQMGILPGAKSAPAGSKIGVVTDSQMAVLKSDVGAFSENLPEILSLVKKLNHSASIVVFTLYNPIPPVLDNLSAAADQLLQAENQVIEATAHKFGAYVADSYSMFQGRQADLVLPLDVHPTALGQLELATAAEIAISTGQ